MAEFPSAQPHGELEEVFENIFFVQGTVCLNAPVTMKFSRNMTVVRQDGALTLINSMRLGDEGLAALEALGKVENVIRLAGFHGMDDPFYKDRYDAKVWAVATHVYARGFNAIKTKPEDGYFQPDVRMTSKTELPIAGASLETFDCVAGEGVLHIDREGGILVTGDSLQNWFEADRFFNFPAKVAMKLMGFIKPHAVGPGWLKQAKPNKAEVRSILELEFEHLLPVHGGKVIGGAKEKYRPAIERL